MCVVPLFIGRMAAKQYSLHPKLIVLPTGVLCPKMFVQKTFRIITLQGEGQLFWDRGSRLYWWVLQLFGCQAKFHVGQMRMTYTRKRWFPLTLTNNTFERVWSHYSQEKMTAKPYSLLPKPIVLPTGVLYPKMFLRQTFRDRKLVAVGQSVWDGGRSTSHWRALQLFGCRAKFHVRWMRVTYTRKRQFPLTLTNDTFERVWSHYSQEKMAAKPYSLRPKPIALPPEVLYPKMSLWQTFWDRKLPAVGQSFWDGGRSTLYWRALQLFGCRARCRSWMAESWPPAGTPWDSINNNKIKWAWAPSRNTLRQEREREGEAHRERGAGRGRGRPARVHVGACGGIRRFLWWYPPPHNVPVSLPLAPLQRWPPMAYLTTSCSACFQRQAWRTSRMEQWNRGELTISYGFALVEFQKNNRSMLQTAGKN